MASTVLSITRGVAPESEPVHALALTIAIACQLRNTPEPWNLFPLFNDTHADRTHSIVADLMAIHLPVNRDSVQGIRASELLK